MLVDERLALIRLKIDRASKHISDLEAAIGKFFASRPYKVGTKRNPQTRRLIYYVESVSAVPVCLAPIAGDAIHNLRSALDHLAQQLYLVGTNDAGYRNQTSFLIANNAQTFISALKGKVEGMRQGAIDALCAIEPYKGGKGEDLWVLHRLNNIDKHRLIVTVGSSFSSVDVGAVLGEKFRRSLPKNMPVSNFDFQIPLRPADNLFPLKAGAELFIDEPDAEISEKIIFRFDIVIHEPEVVDGKPLVQTIQSFSDLVSGVVAGFKPHLN